MNNDSNFRGFGAGMSYELVKKQVREMPLTETLLYALWAQLAVQDLGRTENVHRESLRDFYRKARALADAAITRATAEGFQMNLDTLWPTPDVLTLQNQQLGDSDD